MKKILTFVIIILVSSSFLFSQSVSNALDFDGFDDYVAIPNGTALLAGINQFSMCGWVYPTNPNTAWPDFEGYFGIKNEGICDFYIVQLYGLGLEARITTTNGTFTLNPADLSEVTMNEWQHFALVYDSTHLKVYYNGILDGSIAATGTIPYNNMELWIGSLDFQFNDFYLDGKVDEVTIWNKALSESEINDYMCISGDPSMVPNLMAYYDFNEEEGLVLPDYFGNYNGTLTNMSGVEWIESEVCDPGFDIIFVVTEDDGTTPVAEAQVNLEGNIKPTDENGEAVFSNYDPGTYIYEVSKSGYYPSAGTVEVIDENVIEDVLLSQILYYDITFAVTEEPGGVPVDSAIVNVGGILQYTNQNGETTFTGYLPGTYGYVVTKDGYNLASGDAIVVDENITVEVGLLLISILENKLEIPKISPNPGNGLFQVYFKRVPDYITVDNLVGERLIHNKVSQNEFLLNIKDYPPGIYLLSCYYGPVKHTQKLLKLD
jgi:hypothetical protein